jgi:hypothetical protein
MAFVLMRIILAASSASVCAGASSPSNADDLAPEVFAPLTLDLWRESLDFLPSSLPGRKPGTLMLLTEMESLDVEDGSFSGHVGSIGSDMTLVRTSSLFQMFGHLESPPFDIQLPICRLFFPFAT